MGIHFGGRKATVRFSTDRFFFTLQATANARTNRWTRAAGACFST